MVNTRSLLAAAFVGFVAAAQSPGQAVSLDAKALHVLNRCTFGPTLGLWQNLSQTPTTGPSSVDVWIDQQLMLTGPEDPRVPFLLGTQTFPRTKIQELKEEQFVRACFSRYQLREVMTQFWERHFSTFYPLVQQVVTGTGGTPTDGVAMIDEANQGFRTNALGRFEDLLLNSAGSRAMLIYLDTFVNSTAGGAVPNENHARELLELHTLGPDENGVPNYLHADIVEFARCLAGWNFYRPGLPGIMQEPRTGLPIASPALFQRVFVPAWHAVGPINLGFDPTTTLDDLAFTGVATSDIDARRVLHHLANMEQTKRFVCRKLIRYFLADDAVEPALLTQCTTAWGSAGGDISAVLNVLLKSPQFQGPTYRWQRLRMPMEWTCWVVRSLDGNASNLQNLDGVIATTDRMGQVLHSYQTPEGYPLASRRQCGSQIYLDAAHHAQAFLRTMPPFLGIVEHDLPSMVIQGIGQVVPGGNPDQPADAANYFLRRLYLGEWSTADLTRLTDLSQATIFGVPAPLDHVNAAADYAQRINLLAALAVAMPQAFKK